MSFKVCVKYVFMPQLSNGDYKAPDHAHCGLLWFYCSDDFLKVCKNLILELRQ